MAYDKTRLGTATSFIGFSLPTVGAGQVRGALDHAVASAESREASDGAERAQMVAVAAGITKGVLRSALC